MTERGDRLDNPIWHALTTEQTRFAERDGDAVRFQPAVTLLAGLRETGDAALAALAGLVKPGERTGLFLDEIPALPAGVAVADHAGLVQMVFDGALPDRAATEGLLELGAADAPEMLALAETTRPGPFGTRTAELGTFLGLRDGARLIAMAGQRMRLPGLVEVSAVCTDPAYLGRGLAARLITAQLALITGADKGVFLHVRADNARAIGLYERLGFRIRRRALYVVVTALAMLLLACGGDGGPPGTPEAALERALTLASKGDKVGFARTLAASARGQASSNRQLEMLSYWLWMRSLPELGLAEGTVEGWDAPRVDGELSSVARVRTVVRMRSAYGDPPERPLPIVVSLRLESGGWRIEDAQLDPVPAWYTTMRVDAGVDLDDPYRGRPPDLATIADSFRPPR